MHRFHRVAAVAAALAVSVLGACQPGTSTPTGGTIDPCLTGTGITCDASFGHLAGTPSATATPQGRLAVVLGGTGSIPQNSSKLVSTLRDAGFHVVSLRYRSSIGTGTACPAASSFGDLECFRRFRSETLFGENVADPTGAAYDSASVQISQADSVMNRLLHLVGYLAATAPTEGWSQYLQGGETCTSFNATYAACDLDWSKVVVVGHSLGSGVGLYLSKFVTLDRVVLLSGSFDEAVSGPNITVAPWVTEGGFATPASSMYGLQHTNEPNFAPTRAEWNALGMAGPLTSVDTQTAPYGGSHQLTTSLTPACTTDPNREHNSTAQDQCTPGTPAQLAPAWVFLTGA